MGEVVNERDLARDEPKQLLLSEPESGQYDERGLNRV